MLALTDTQLDMLAIVATAVAPQKPAAWLEQIAQKLDPPARPATRQARWRAATQEGGWPRCSSASCGGRDMISRGVR